MNKLIAMAMGAGIALTATTATAHTCGIPDAQLSEWRGYGVDGEIYDRGEYLFTSDTKHFSNGDALTTHSRIYKDDCRVQQTSIMHKNEDAKSDPTPQELLVLQLLELSDKTQEEIEEDINTLLTYVDDPVGGFNYANSLFFEYKMYTWSTEDLDSVGNQMAALLGLIT